MTTYVSLKLELEQAQVDLIDKILQNKIEELNVIIKNPDGLSAETIRDIQLEHRQINEILRELRFYSN